MVRIGATASLLLLAASYAYARAPYWKRSEHLFVLLEDGVSIDTILSTPIGSNFILESTHGRLATISPKTYASEILNPGAEVKLQGGNDGKATNLKACIGECDSDKQCAEGLKCFQRDGYESIPGCAGRGKKAWDYCYSPEASFDSKLPKAVSSKLASLKPQIELAAKANVDLLSTLPGVRSVSINELDDVEVDALRGDRKLSAQVDPTWGLDVIDGSIDGSYAHSYDGSDVHIYVVDSGLRLTHEEFAGRIGEGANFRESGSLEMFDDCGHGTHVASTALGNKWGVAKGATLHPVRVLGWNGEDCLGTTADIIDAITWSADHAKQNGWRCVINLSLGGYSKHAEKAEAVHDAVEKGCVVVAAAGNDGGDACSASLRRNSYCWNQPAWGWRTSWRTGAPLDKQNRRMREHLGTWNGCRCS